MCREAAAHGVPGYFGSFKVTNFSPAQELSPPRISPNQVVLQTSMPHDFIGISSTFDGGLVPPKERAKTFRSPRVDRPQWREADVRVPLVYEKNMRVYPCMLLVCDAAVELFVQTHVKYVRDASALFAKRLSEKNDTEKIVWGL